MLVPGAPSITPEPEVRAARHGLHMVTSTELVMPDLPEVCDENHPCHFSHHQKNDPVIATRDVHQSIRAWTKGIPQPYTGAHVGGLKCLPVLVRRG